MDREQAVRIAERYAYQVKTLINPMNIILYGSYAKGDAHADSDIDIAVIFDKFEGDYWSTVKKLHELTINIDTRIEPVLLEYSNDPSGFVQAIQREGLAI